MKFRLDPFSPSGASLVPPIAPVIVGGGSSTNSGVQSVVAGVNVIVDNTDPANPIVSSTGGSGGSTAWGLITGTLSDQTDLNTALGGKVDNTTTVNGHSLSSNVTVSKSDVGLGSVPNTDFTSAVSANTAKISFDSTSSTRLANTSGTNTGDNATNSQYSGLASSKQDNVTLTTSGTSGAATFVSNVLNIPQYSGGGGGITRSINAISGAITGGSTALTDYSYTWSGSTPYTFTLPTAVSNLNAYAIINNSSVNQTFATTSSQTVNGSATGTIIPGQSLTVLSDGSNWEIT